MKTINNPISCFNTLQNDLERIAVWAKQWLVTFNAAKTVYMLFSLKRQIPTYPALTFEGVELKLVSEHCHLGVTLNSKVTWHSHIQKISTKAYRVINMLKRIRHLVSRSTMQSAYKTLVRPIIEYGNVVYDNLSQDLSKKLEHIQRDAALLCTGAYRRSGTDKLIEEIGWETLEVRRRYQRLVLLYKIHNGLTPRYLHSMLPMTCGQRTGYSLRNTNQYTIPFCRTGRYKLSFVPATIKDWNELPDHIKGSSSLTIFKSNLKKALFTNRQNKLYQYGSNLGNKYHTWLRLGLSPLRDHLFRHHIVDTNTCSFCSQGTETSEHFLCACPTFHSQRMKLYSSLMDIIGNVILTMAQSNLTRLLLFGVDSVPLEHNIKVFEAVQTFLIQCKRFNFTQEA